MGSELLTKEEKERILKTLEVDIEFRYAVAGLIGLNEILKRLDRHEEELVRIREEQKRIWEEIARLWNEVAKLREDMVKGFERHDREIEMLRKDFLKMVERMDRIETRLTRVERALEHLSISIEEEAQEVISQLLMKRGIQISLSSIKINERYELDIYGSIENITIVGEAKVRASNKTVERLLKRIENVKDVRPDLFRGRIIPVLYCARFLGDSSKAEERGVWLIVSGKEVTKLPL
ncbi:conserved hypothetical protein [Ignisphaera aggregans DSM 17230]|uniref:DUF8196 domain-containing protein n=1 Tax=Ignisphaera aggregans (strain DSM 17230 / JCM 13409 / AQ1.S1) TaxID=583356 RepID=E0SST5_IGNAA|nr:conserved hypothetical protein [Ignisphaera aggregans DSM 17230]